MTALLVAGSLITVCLVVIAWQLHTLSRLQRGTRQ